MRAGAPALCASHGEPFDTRNRFPELLVFQAQSCQNLVDIQSFLRVYDIRLARYFKLVRHFCRY